MELTRLQKALLISSAATALKESEVETDLKPSEAMKMLAIICEEVETLPQDEKDTIAAQQLKEAVRVLYDDLVGELMVYEVYLVYAGGEKMVVLQIQDVAKIKISKSHVKMFDEKGAVVFHTPIEPYLYCKRISMG